MAAVGPEETRTKAAGHGAPGGTGCASGAGSTSTGGCCSCTCGTAPGESDGQCQRPDDGGDLDGESRRKASEPEEDAGDDGAGRLRGLSWPRGGGDGRSLVRNAATAVPVSESSFSSTSSCSEEGLRPRGTSREEQVSSVSYPVSSDDEVSGSDFLDSTEYVNSVIRMVSMR